MRAHVDPATEQGTVQHSALHLHSSHIPPASRAAQLNPGHYNPINAWPQHWLSWLSGQHSSFTTGWFWLQTSAHRYVTLIFTILPSPSGQLPGKHLKSCYDHFLANPFQFIIHLFTIPVWQFEIPTALLTQINKQQKLKWTTLSTRLRYMLSFRL